MKRTFLAVLVLVACFAGTATADMPQLLNYQGVLTDGSGVAVPDNTYSIVFAIYNVAVGGSALWTETDNVIVSKGTFSVTLGTISGLASLLFNETYYLGMSVGGGPELPRQILTTSPYSFTAKSVLGTNNVFPASGNVGIGTTSPTYPLTVNTSSQIGIQLNGSEASFASIYVNAANPIASPLFGLLREGTLRSYQYVDASNRWHLMTSTGNEAIVVPSNGNVGMGTDPTERLHVGGGIRIGNTSGTGAGTMRWSGSDFEGYNGAAWQSFTATGGGALPAGAPGQTLRHDVSDWVATSSLYNNGTQIGIGTVDPNARLDVVGTGIQDLKVETSSSTGRGSLVLKSTGGGFDYLELDKYAPSAGGTTAGGILLANLSRVTTGTQAGPLMLQVTTSNPMYFVTGNLERMRLDASGNLGINTTAPGAKLHVDGNQWDLTNTEGDFKIGDATYRLKFGVATGGGGAGTAGIRVAGGAGRLILGSGSAEVLGLDATGAVDIGSSSANGELKLFRSGVANRMLRAYTSSSGGYLDLFDEASNYTAALEADANGVGGFFAVYRDTGSQGFTVDGNASGVNEPRVTISGSSQSVTFDMDQSGTNTVVLPNGAIHSPEIADEPGAASYVEGGGLGIALTTGAYNTLATRAIVTPGAGYVLVIATCQGQEIHTNGTAGSANFGVSTASTSLPTNQDVNWTVPSGFPTALSNLPITVHGLFSVASGGSHTYYFLGYPISGAFNCFDFQLTLVYIPTGYGTIDPTVAGASVGEAEAGGGRALSEAQVASARAESEAANSTRIQRELDAMRAELEAVKARLENK